MCILKEYSKKITFILMFSIFFILSGNLIANANPQPEPRTPNNSTNGVTPINEQSNISDSDISGDSQLPNVSFDQVKDKVETKTFDVVSLMQVFVKPFASIIFLGCACISLYGAIGRSAILGKGLVGMFISGAVYTCALNAPEILNFISNWLTK